MDLYLAIVVIMLVLAVAGLVVGVSNDAVNFLNSALGSKAAPRYVIMTVASVGIIVGAITSSGMMEVARSGVFHPQMFTFAEVMLLFLAVMFTNVILLDLFNTLGMPTSTTVSLVFGLLGAAVGICVFKLSSGSVVTMPDGDPASMADMINTGNAMAIIGGILISVAIAFVCGTVVMYITRLIFSFRYQKKLRTVGALWCGIALTAISYFAVFKGLKGTSVIPAHAMAWMEHHTLAMLAAMVAGWSLLMSLLSLLKINILRLTVLAGTFSLALAFAGNDLVNFIGVFVAGVDAYDVAKTTGDSSMLMGSLNDPVVANMLILFLSGLVMVVTLWFSKKARAVSDTEINLARQDVGVERFGSTSISRAIVRSALNVNRNYEKIHARPHSAFRRQPIRAGAQPQGQGSVRPDPGDGQSDGGLDSDLVGYFVAVAALDDLCDIHGRDGQLAVRPGLGPRKRRISDYRRADGDRGLVFHGFGRLYDRVRRSGGSGLGRYDRAGRADRAVRLPAVREHRAP